jgi:hypothetical protein
MPKKFENLAGQIFSRLTVIERVENDSRGKSQWKCVCDCGGTKIVCAKYLKSGDTKSCGCFKHESLCRGRVTHGQSYSVTYKSWDAMKSRCYNPNTERYPSYGGKGVVVCDRWKESFDNFLADLGDRPPGTSLGRFGDVGNYEPGNVSWQTQAEQVANWRPDRARSWSKNKKIKAVHSVVTALQTSQLNNETHVSI